MILADRAVRGNDFGLIYAWMRKQEPKPTRDRTAKTAKRASSLGVLAPAAPVQQGRPYHDSVLCNGHCRAMGQIEGTEGQPADSSDLLALLNVLQSGSLDGAQQDAAQALRVAIRSLDLARVLESENDGSVMDLV